MSTFKVLELNVSRSLHANKVTKVTEIVVFDPDTEQIYSSRKLFNKPVDQAIRQILSELLEWSYRVEQFKLGVPMNSIRLHAVLNENSDDYSTYDVLAEKVSA